MAELARNVAGLGRDQRFVLVPGPGLSGPERNVRRDRFAVDSRHTERVRDQHVLLVDDTWTSGSKAQSAALAVRSAGASSVSLLVVARWCRHDWPDHRPVLDRFTDPYDTAVCPVSGGDCPT